MEMKVKQKKQAAAGSLPAMIRENISCNIAVLWLGLVVMLFNDPVNLALRLTEIRDRAELAAGSVSVSISAVSGMTNGNGPTSVFYAEKTASSVAKASTDAANLLLSGGGSLLEFIIVVAAALCAVSMFRYLFSRKAVDFYHSQPVTRSRRFAANFLSGVLIMLFCMLAGFLGVLLVAAFYQVDGLMISQALWFQAGYFLSFLLCYALFVTAVLLTGSLWSAVGGSICLFAAGPAVAAIITALCSTYFHTWLGTRETPFEMWYRLSPVYVLTCFSTLLEEVRKGWQPLSALHPYFLGQGLGALLLTAFNLLLLQKRPSESAGRPLAFQGLGRPVRILLSCYGGLLLSFLGEGYGFVWSLFFLIVGTILSHAILEGVLHMDVRAVLRNRVELLLCALGSAVLFCAFVFDFFGYDSFLPRTAQVEELGVNVMIGDYPAQWAIPRSEYDAAYAERYGGRNISYTQAYWGNQPEVMNAMALRKQEDVQAVLGLAQSAITEQGDRLNWLNGQEDAGTTVYVRYQLKNGTETYRHYEVQEEALKTYMPALYASRDYKEGIYPILKLSPEKIGRFGLLYCEADGQTAEARLAEGEAALEQTLEQPAAAAGTETAQMKASQKEAIQTEADASDTGASEAAQNQGGTDTFEVGTVYGSGSALNLSRNPALQKRLLAALQQDLLALRYEDLETYTSSESEAVGYDESGGTVYEDKITGNRYLKDLLYYVPYDSVEAERRSAADASYPYGWNRYDDDYPILDSFREVQAVLKANGLLQ